MSAKTPDTFQTNIAGVGPRGPTLVKRKAARRSRETDTASSVLNKTKFLFRSTRRCFEPLVSRQMCRKFFLLTTSSHLSFLFFFLSLLSLAITASIQCERNVTRVGKRKKKKKKEKREKNETRKKNKIKRKTKFHCWQLHWHKHCSSSFFFLFLSVIDTNDDRLEWKFVWCVPFYRRTLAGFPPLAD